jgi:hypothetical protein
LVGVESGVVFALEVVGFAVAAAVVLDGETASHQFSLHRKPNSEEILGPWRRAE